MLKLAKFVPFSIFFAYSVFANDLKIVTEEYPPYNFSANNNTIIKGISSDTVLEMAKRANVSAKISIYPWARAINLAKTQKDTCLISVIRNEERENKFKWIGPIVSDHLALFALENNSKIVIRSLEEAKKYVIGTYNESATIPLLKKYEMKFEIASEDKLNPRMLNSKRIDLWIGGSKAGPFIANKEGVRVKEIFTFDESTDMYMACNKKISDEMVAKYNRILKDLTNDGTRKEIEKRYSQQNLL